METNASVYSSVIYISLIYLIFTKYCYFTQAILAKQLRVSIFCLGDVPADKLQGKRLTEDWGREIAAGSRAFSIYRFASREAIRRRHPGFIQYCRSTRRFCTKSTYEGNYNSVGFAGHGQYVYPHGVRYEGTFKNGRFHGRGCLTYPLGHSVDGIWKKGKLIKHMFRSSDGLAYTTPWRYCQAPDRRFQTEKLEHLHAAGEEILTNKQPTKPLGPGCYDTEDGYYDSNKRCVFKDENFCVKEGSTLYHCHQTPGILRVGTVLEENLIKNNFRRAEDVNVGYFPELYEVWTTGESSDMERTKKKLRKIPFLVERVLSLSGLSVSIDSNSSDSST